MASKKRGVFGKYRIEKADGSAIDSEACYFVLRLDSDPAARAAMRTYARECGNAKLADGIVACLDEIETPPCGCREAACPHERMFSSVWRYGDENPA